MLPLNRDVPTPEMGDVFELAEWLFDVTNCCFSKL